MKFVEEYSGQAFTFQKDVLPAMSSIAQVFSQAPADGYQAGLLNGDLWPRLFWEIHAGSQSQTGEPKISETSVCSE